MSNPTQTNRTFDIGEIVAGESKIFELEWESDFAYPFHVESIEPFCSCLKVRDYNHMGVFPKEFIAANDDLKELDLQTNFKIKFEIKKNNVGEYGERVELKLDSPFAGLTYYYLLIKYTVISKIKNEQK